MAKKNQNINTRYEVITQEDPETGDVILPLPLPLLNKLGWKEGDIVEWKKGEDGQFILLKKA